MRTRPPARKPSARELIEHFKMERIPHEGAWFAPSHPGPDHCTGPRGAEGADRLDGTVAAASAGTRRAWSAIYCMETRTDFSALHRLAADEIWNYHLGAPLDLLLLHPDGRGQTVVIGPEVLAGQHPQFLVPRGVWQGSRPSDGYEDDYSFFGTTVVPGFDYADYEPGVRSKLQAQYPAFAAHIASLTRDTP